ncbi:hypothetical protein CLOM_g1522 [Closterium sp. NIES-68]|nr:hypothetical protein CLOM_g1522 [Closterium sp. NIES-68]GJP60781.1 hypothetical protein CLOP_g18005 [Closterium sp. NIES-67]
MASGTLLVVGDSPRRFFPPIKIDRGTADSSVSSPKSPLERQLSSLTPSPSFDERELTLNPPSPATEGAESTWHFRNSVSYSFQPSEGAEAPTQADKTAHRAPPTHSTSPSFVVDFFSAASRTVRDLLSGEGNISGAGNGGRRNRGTLLVFDGFTTEPSAENAERGDGCDAERCGGENAVTIANAERHPREAHARATADCRELTYAREVTDSRSAVLSTTPEAVAAKTASSSSSETPVSTERASANQGSAKSGWEIAAGKAATGPQGAALRQRSLRWSAATTEQRRGEVCALGGGMHGAEYGDGNRDLSGVDESRVTDTTTTSATTNRNCDETGAGNQSVAGVDGSDSGVDRCANGGRDGSSTYSVGAVSTRRQDRPRYNRNHAHSNRSARPRKISPVPQSCVGGWDSCNDDGKHSNGDFAKDFPCTHTLVKRPVSATSTSVLLKPYADIASRFVVHHREIGSGQYGSIRKCLEIETGRVYACKTIKKNQIKGSEEADDIRREVASMWVARDHPHIVTLLDTFEDRKAVHLVMELCRGGDLFDRITKLGPYSEPSGAKLCQSLTHVVLHCHLNGIVHRDIKPENILLKNSSDDTNILLADFGAAAFATEGEVIKEVVGTPEYMAPEMWGAVFDDSNKLLSTPREHGVEYNSAVDVWSMGVVMYVAMSGVPPFWATVERTVAKAVLTRPVVFRPAKWGGVSEECKELIERMLEKDWRKRITPVEILEHPWIVQHVGKHK